MNTQRECVFISCFRKFEIYKADTPILGCLLESIDNYLYSYLIIIFVPRTIFITFKNTHTHKLYLH
jgi:hypothetical protein